MQNTKLEELAESVEVKRCMRAAASPCPPALMSQTLTNLLYLCRSQWRLSRSPLGRLCLSAWCEKLQHLLVQGDRLERCSLVATDSRVGLAESGGHRRGFSVNPLWGVLSLLQAGFCAGLARGCTHMVAGAESIPRSWYAPIYCPAGLSSEQRQIHLAGEEGKRSLEAIT